MNISQIVGIFSEVKDVTHKVEVLGGPKLLADISFENSLQNAVFLCVSY